MTQKGRAKTGNYSLSKLQIEALRFHNIGPFDLTIQDAQCVCLSGPSGAGKTLFLRSIADLDPHEGKIYLDDIECQNTDAPQWRRQVAMLPSESQWWRETVGDHFTETEQNWLERLGFGREVMTWQVSRLSSGERHRLALARLLCNRPKALLLDEPTGNLDFENVLRVEALISDYRRDTGTPVLWVTHDPDQPRRVAEKHFRMDNTKLVEQAL